jgi:ankyrin repeat protein
MKTLKLNSIPSLGVLLVSALLFTGCAQNKKEPVAEAAINAPKMDLQTAVISDNLAVVRQHIDAGTALNQKDAFSSSTPLITAATFGRTEIAKALIDAGADLSPKNNDGSTALHAAAFFCRLEVVQLLIDAKADKTILNNFGATPAQTVQGPFGEIKPIYEMMQQQLAPMGFQLDMAEVEKARPVIAMMLQ